MRQVILHGALAEFGGPYNFHVQTVPEAIKALCQIKGFKERLQQGAWRLVGKTQNGSRDIGESQLTIGLGGVKTIEIFPVVAGAGDDGVGKIILGVALIAAAFAFAPAIVGAAGPTLGMSTAAVSVGGFSITYANIAMFGISMLMGGVSQALTPTPAISDYSTAEAKGSYLFNGPVNTSEQGGPVPLIFGRAMVGSKVVSAGMSSERTEYVDPVQGGISK